MDDINIRTLYKVTSLSGVTLIVKGQPLVNVGLNPIILIDNTYKNILMEHQFTNGYGRFIDTSP